MRSSATWPLRTRPLRTRPLDPATADLATTERTTADLATADLARLVATFRMALSQSLAAGFPGLRITGEMAGYPWPSGALAGLAGWERMMSRMLGDVGVAVICQYDRRQLDAPAAAIIAAEHSGVVTDRHGPPRRCSSPPPRRRRCGSRANST